MVQRIRVLIAKSNDLSSNAGSYIVERFDSHKMPSNFHMYAMAPVHHTHTHTK